MALPTYATVLSQINTYIVANGNNEITANVLNPILELILDFANNNIGDLDTLTTEEKNSIVEAINSLKQNFDDLVNNGVQLYTGINDPNDVPPPTYKYADFYMQVDIDSLPVKLWQWNGFVWTDESGEPATESDNVINNSDVTGATVTDALNTLYTEKLNVSDIPSLIYCWGDSMTFGTGSTDNNNYPSILAKSVNWKTINNGVPGETSTQIKNRFVAFYTSNPEELKKPVIIWAGRNNYSSGTTVKADIATMIAMLPHRNYLVIGVTNSNPGEPIGNSGYDQIVALNNDLLTLYGSRFLDVRKWLVAHYNPLIPQDVIDHGLDLPPSSLLSDNIHLNNSGYRLVNDLICKSFPYLSNESDIIFESVNAKNLYLPNTLNSILKTGVNGLVGNSVLYENDFNVGLGLSPVSTPDSNNFELINGSSIMGRVSVPQLGMASNAYGVWYAAKYKTSNFSALALVDGNTGTFGVYTAPSGVAGADITYTNRFFITNDGKIGIGNTSPAEKLDVTGNGKFSGTVTASPATLSTELVTKGQLDAVAPTSGTYTPTFSSGVNVTLLTGGATYFSIGDLVTVYLKISLNITSSATASSFKINLPINRTTSNPVLPIGSGAIGGGVIIPAKASLDTANNTGVIINFVAGAGSGSVEGNVSFQYRTTD